MNALQYPPPARRRFQAVAAMGATWVLAAAAGWAQVVSVPAAILAVAEGTITHSPQGDREWTDVKPRRALQRGDRLWTDRGSRAAIEAGAHQLVMDGQTLLALTAVGDSGTQVSVTQGSLAASVKQLAPNENFEIDTPNLALRARAGGELRIDVDREQGTTRVLVQSGGAVAYGEHGEQLELRAGQRVTFGERSLARKPAPFAVAADDFDRWVAAHPRQTVAAAGPSQPAVHPDKLAALRREQLAREAEEAKRQQAEAKRQQAQMMSLAAGAARQQQAAQAKAVAKAQALAAAQPQPVVAQASAPAILKAPMPMPVPPAQVVVKAPVPAPAAKPVAPRAVQQAAAPKPQPVDARKLAQAKRAQELQAKRAAEAQRIAQAKRAREEQKLAAKRAQDARRLAQAKRAGEEAQRSAQARREHLARMQDQARRDEEARADRVAKEAAVRERERREQQAQREEENRREEQQARQRSLLQLIKREAEALARPPQATTQQQTQPQRPVPQGIPVRRVS